MRGVGEIVVDGGLTYGVPLSAGGGGVGWSGELDTDGGVNGHGGRRVQGVIHEVVTRDVQNVGCMLCGGGGGSGGGGDGSFPTFFFNLAHFLQCVVSIMMWRV